MSILNVNKINPVGGGSTITIAGIASVTNNLTASNISAGSSVTANSFHGDGSNLTGITQTTINNNADNRVITGSGTANTLNGESELTYNGSGLLSMVSTGSNSKIKFQRTGTSIGGHIQTRDESNDKGLTYVAQDGNSAKAGHVFITDQTSDGSSPQERLRIGSAGQLGIAGANYGTSGQVLTSGGASAAPTWATPSSGLSMADQWRLTNTQVVSSQDVLLTNWERPDTSGTGGGAYIGGGMSNSSGTFSFPVTGIYLITFEGCFNGTNNTRYSQIDIVVTKNNSNYYDAARSFFYYNRSTGTSTGASASCSFIMDVDNTSNDKVRFTSSQDNIGQHQVIGDSTVNTTTVTFLRLGDT
jgi:hypothetical protein